MFLKFTKDKWNYTNVINTDHIKQIIMKEHEIQIVFGNEHFLTLKNEADFKIFNEWLESANVNVVAHMAW